MPFILDADWIIQALAGRSQAVTALDRLAPQQVTLSAVTVGEICEVAFNSANPEAHIERFRHFLHPYRVLPVNEPIAFRFAEVRSFLRRRGQLISDFDIIVAATALRHDLTVLTFNVRHFERIPDLKIYSPR
ncbi:MAG: type II toxin-antitoxin system VapC family toxin [Dehalococcoidia bacterium]